MADGILLKIERANKHIEELHGVVQEFKATYPYKVARKRNPETGEHVVYVHTADPLPPIIPVIAGDVIQNLYSSLDYLASELVVANKSPISTKTAFPITKNIPTTKDEITRYEGQVEGMRQEVKDLLRSMNTYRGADNLFWTLHKLNNINKHRSLVTIGFATSVLSRGNPWLNLGPLQQGSEIARLPANLEDDEQIHLLFDIAVNEPEADAINHAMILVLRGCYNTVKRTVQAFEMYR
jgi:hypothetical protein